MTYSKRYVDVPKKARDGKAKPPLQGILFPDGSVANVVRGTDDGCYYAELGSGGSGADGQSAYELWLAAGNTGTIQDFLDSLAGNDGNDGGDGTVSSGNIVCTTYLGIPLLSLDGGETFKPMSGYITQNDNNEYQWVTADGTPGFAWSSVAPDPQELSAACNTGDDGDELNLVLAISGQDPITVALKDKIKECLDDGKFFACADGVITDPTGLVVPDGATMGQIVDLDGNIHTYCRGQWRTNLA